MSQIELVASVKLLFPLLKFQNLLNHLVYFLFINHSKAFNYEIGLGVYIDQDWKEGSTENHNDAHRDKTNVIKSFLTLIL